MDKISLMLDNLETTMLRIGRVGENLHTQVRVNCIRIFHDYPNATTSLTVQPPNGEAYPATIDREGVVIVWDVLDSDLTEVGNGQVQFTFTDDDEIIKTVIGSTQILPSIEPKGEAPTPIENWIDEANELLNEFGEIDQMTASAETVAAGVPADVEVSKVDGHLHLDFSIPRGQSGNETIDDNAGIGDDDVVWSADKSATEITGLKSAILLQEETIPDTTQTISFDSSGNVSSIVHKDGSNNTIRSDAFTFGANTITEVRTLYTGETLTIVTNTTTLVTTVTYAAA
jgi:hypothetical protein